jgi:hypothetical protein
LMMRSCPCTSSAAFGIERRGSVDDMYIGGAFVEVGMNSLTG